MAERSADNDPGTNIAPPPSISEEEDRTSSKKRSNDPELDLRGAILSGSVAHVKTLVEIGTDILDIRHGQSAVSLALSPSIGYPNREICEFLLKSLANKKSWEWVEEHLNSSYKQKDLQVLAKAFGCNTYVNGRRRTHTELVKSILDVLGSPNSNVVGISPSSESVMTAGQAPNVLQGEGITTALHIAAETSDDRTISTLVLKGDFTAVDERGKTPLLIALNKGNAKTVLLILNSMVTQKGRSEIENVICLPPYQRKDLQKLCRLLRISTNAGSKQAKSEELASSVVMAILGEEGGDPLSDAQQWSQRGDANGATAALKKPNSSGEALDRAALTQLADAATATHTTGDEGGTTNLILGPGLQPARAPPGEQFWPRPENSQKDLQQEGGGDKPLWGGGFSYSQKSADGMSQRPFSAAATVPVPVGAEEPPLSGASVAAANIGLSSIHVPDDSVQWRGLKGADLTLRMALMKGGDATTIQQALDAGADPRAPSHDGRTAFHAAPNPYALKAMLVALINTVGEEAAGLHFSEGNTRYRQFHLQNFARMMGRRFRVVGRGRRLTAPELVDTIIGAALGRMEKDYPVKLAPQDQSGAATTGTAGGGEVPDSAIISPSVSQAVAAVEQSNVISGVKKAPTRAGLGGVNEQPPHKRLHV